MLAGKTVVAVAAGAEHNLALCSDGSVAAWGINGAGELGNNRTGQSSVPVTVDLVGVLSGKTVVAVAAGITHSLALCSDGTLAAWGANPRGELGNGTTQQSTLPVTVSSSSLGNGERYAAAFSGSYARHNFALITSPPFPSVSSLAATNLTKTGATLSGTVNPNGSATTVQFEYGTTTSYGSSASVTLSPNDGLGVQDVSANLTGLTPGSIYHYRLTATNAVSTVSTTDGTFTTSINVAATYNSATGAPVTAPSFSAAGATFSATLNFAPITGTTLMVVKNTGSSFINGTFSNLAQGQEVTLSYGGINYRFIANYYGGTGNDLVLQWAQTRPVAWGENTSGQIGDNSTTDRLVPVDVFSSGVLASKRVVSVAMGQSHSLALCSDGTVAAWGFNYSGQLGNNSTADSLVPVAVSTAGVLSGKTIVAVATGDSHSLALCSDGTLAAWGYNNSGQLGNRSTTNSSVPVAVDTAGVLSGKTIVAVAAGNSHSLALCSDGTLAAWGWGSGSSVPVAVDTAGVLAGKTVVAVAAGGSHSLALCSDGTVVAWGDNFNGQLGINSLLSSNVPVEVSTAGVLSGKTVVAVAAGYYHSLALCSDGSVAAWGQNSSGQLGNNSTANSSVPVAVSTADVLSAKTVIAVAAGITHSLALCSDGTLAAWGANPRGELGNGTTQQSTLPVAVSSSSLGNGERYAAAFSGFYARHNLALIASPPFPSVSSLAATNLTKTGATLSGTVNPNGSATTVQFEYGTTTSYGSSASVTLSPNDGLGVQDVSANLTGLTPGSIYHYRLTATNAVSTVSTTDGTFTTSINVAATYNSATGAPLTAPSFSAAGATFSATLNFAPITGTTLMVVKNTGSSFINGTFSNLAQGQEVTLSYGGINYRFIANYYGGTGNDLVLQWAQTRPVAWGYNSYGQLGNNSTVNGLVPVAVSTAGVLSGKTVSAVAAGQYHCLALCSDGTVAAWGYNSDGQLGNNSTTNSRVPVAVNTAGVLSGKTVVAVAAGKYHSLALCSDGTVAAWGSNNFGQLGNNNTADSLVPIAVSTAGVLSGKTVVAIAAGGDHSLVLCSDGTVAAWGDNSDGQLGNNSWGYSGVPVAVSTTGVLSGKTVVAVAAGADHSLALCSDGTVAAWGDNSNGQLGINSTDDRFVPVPVGTKGMLDSKTVIAIAAGSSHSLALCSDGSIAAWGENFNGQLGNNGMADSLVPVAVSTVGVLSGKTVIAITAGSSHSLTLCSDGTVAAWGYNSRGELGNSTMQQSTVPVAVSSSSLGNGERYAAAFSGSYASHNFALVASPPYPAVSSLAATNFTTTGVTLNGTVDPNGSATTVRFEYGTTTSYGSSANVTLSPNDGLGVQNVSANLTGLTPGTIYHYRLTATNAVSTISTTDGTFTTSIDDVVATFNSVTDVPVTVSNAFIKGGTFSATLNFAPPTGTNLMVVRNTGVDFIKGTFSNLAQGQVVTLSYGGIYYRFIANYYGGTGNDLVLQWAQTRLVAWGSNSSGQLGNGSVTSSGAPVAVNTAGVLSGKMVVYVATGQDHSLALCSDGTVASWGSNGFGQLGKNGVGISIVPGAVNTEGVLSGKTVVSVAAGQYHSLALCSDGTVAGWGNNVAGQLGNGSTTNSSVPVAVSTAGVLSGKTVVAVAAGQSHSLALCSDGTVAAWGYNFNGQLGNGSTTNSSVPVAVYTAGVLSGKTVVALSAGGSHSLALCSDGTATAWGSNTYGQLGNNSPTNSSSSLPVAVNTAGVLSGKTVVAVSAGGSHSLALCADGTVAAWGRNDWGQLGNNGLVQQSIVPVAISTAGVLLGKTVVVAAAGQSHSLVLCFGGTAAAWGYNAYGQLGTPSLLSSKVPVAVNSSSLTTGERYAVVFSGPNANHSLGLIASPPAPVVTSLPATNLTSDSAVLNGTVNAASASATVSFDYGLDSSYGSTITGTPSPVTGSTETSVSANLTGLKPDTTYHYRVRATSSSGTTNGVDLIFTTLPHTTGPVGGTMTLEPGSPVDAGSALAVTFANWTDPSMPLTYSVLLDDVVVSAQGATAARNITAPATAGAHTLKGRIYDALGHFAEVTQSFTVIATQEDWRAFYFGTALNEGDAADLADPDGDGANNLFEYVAGLVPTSAQSHFNLRVEAVAGQPGQKAIIFNPVLAGRTYIVKYKESLTDEIWTPLTDIVTSDNGTERTVTDLSAGSGLRFYRVEITRP